jgi:hypothetical protein
MRWLTPSHQQENKTEQGEYGMEILGVKNKWFLVGGLIFCLMAWWVPAGLADEAKTEKQEALQKVETKVEEAKGPELPTWSLQTDILSQYVWRGIALSRNSHLSPGLIKGFPSMSGITLTQPSKTLLE